MPLIVDDSNWKDQLDLAVRLGKGLGGMPKPAGHDSRAYSKVFGAEIPNIPRSEWPARIKEKRERKTRISDCQAWACDNQGSFPTCWSAGTMQAAATARVMQLGLDQHVYLSAMAVAVPISGGRSGGYEGDAVRYLTEHGGVDAKLWGYTDPGRHNGPEIEANRQLHKALESHECEGFDQFATAMLLNLPCTVSYNWWSHVVMLTELVEIESGSYGFRIRNNWGDGYGDKHETHGFGGYAIFREGKGTPSGGFAIRQMTPSVVAA
jgi:hypothetical protein